MNPAFLIQLHPAGPWRYGPGDGGRDRVDTLYRSDRLFSAVTIAFERLGLLEEWLKATVEATSPAVVFSSLFPFQGETLFAPPPATLWPPPAAALRTSSPVFSTKIRWRAARFVPVSLIETLLLSQRLLADQWVTDPESACLLRRDRPQSSPFRVTRRTVAAIDRMKHGHDAHSLACVEFEAGSGLWALASFNVLSGGSGEDWKDRLRSAFRLLADSGFGGRRSSGWGQVSRIEISEGEWPALLFPKLARKKRDERPGANGNISAGHWLLSLFTPGDTDEIDWTQGHYSVTARGGYVETGTSAGQSKKLIRMVEEGSVLKSANSLRGRIVDVAPEGLPHPTYRAGFALSLALPPVDYSATEDETAMGLTELEQALDEALRTAAEQDVPRPASESTENSAEESSESEQETTGTDSTEDESGYEI
jgi:CRISPR type III-A-associated RAMP protein Csm4